MQARPDRDDFAPCECGDSHAPLADTDYGPVCAGCLAYVETREEWECAEESRGEEIHHG